MTISHIQGALIWECPCKECTALEYESLDGCEGQAKTLTEYRRQEWPEVYS